MSAAPEENSRDAEGDPRDAGLPGHAEPGSFDDLIAEESPGLLAYFARRVTPAADAADLLSETLLVLWRRADAVPADPGEARMWMYGVARKVLATHRRTAVRRSALTDKLRAELEANSTHPSVEDSRVELLRDAIAELKPLDREIVRLVHWDGFSLTEVATLLGKRPGTVRSRYHRARARLRHRLGET